MRLATRDNFHRSHTPAGEVKPKLNCRSLLLQKHPRHHHRHRRRRRYCHHRQRRRPTRPFQCFMERSLLLLLALITCAAWPAAQAALDGQAANKHKKPPMVYGLHHKYHSPISAPSVSTGDPNLASLTQRDIRRAAAASSAIFPVRGNVYPDGLYYVSVFIGEPPMPYYLDVDTGSEITWLQCDAPCINCAKGPHPPYRPKKSKLVFCKDPLCVSLNITPSQECVSPVQQCDYEIDYADGGSSLGVLVKDAFYFKLTSGSVVQSHLAFGCGYDQQGSQAISPSPTDGMLGLGNGKSSIVSQLRDQGLVRNIIGHCINGQGGGYLFFGDDLVPSSGMTWIPMSRNPSHKYYSPGPANLILGKQSVIKNVAVIFDSGSSYTYFASQPYQAFVSALKKDLLGKPLRETSDGSLALCWKGAKPFKSILDAKNYFKSLVLDFKNSKKAQLEVSPEGYLIITSKGNVCLGILNGAEVGLDELNIIGDISMQQHVIVYNNEKNEIGWVRANCDRLPNMDGDNRDNEGFTQPYAANMGILKEEPLQCPANNLSPTDRCR